MDETLYWIWLSLACTPDTSTFPRLIAKFSSAREIYEAENYKISAQLDPRASDRSALINKDLDKAKEIYAFCKRNKVGIVTYADEEYPNSLRSIPTPPVLLYYRGKLPNFNKGFYCAIVGTRSLSEYGRREAFELAYDLSCAGATIVSGMALGIDGVAMAGALAAERTTVAVIGSGIDVCYPKEHLTLARATVREGCILTEFAPGTQPSRYNFPRRNRIISGLSAATIVIEGREKSGAVITARHAKAQGRAVYALPGNVNAKNSEASMILFKNGAKPITRAEDIIEDFGKQYPGVLNPFKLKEFCPVDMQKIFRDYKVMSFTRAEIEDDFAFYRSEFSGNSLYSPKKHPQRRSSQDNPVIKESTDFSKEFPSDSVSSPEENIASTEKLSEDETVNSSLSIDATALKIYKRIPLNGRCTIDSLVDENIDLRTVMRALLKLEIGKFIVMLPGEAVARKTK